MPRPGPRDPGDPLPASGSLIATTSAHRRGQRAPQRTPARIVAQLQQEVVHEQQHEQARVAVEDAEHVVPRRPAEPPREHGRHRASVSRRAPRAPRSRRCRVVSIPAYRSPWRATPLRHDVHRGPPGQSSARTSSRASGVETGAPGLGRTSRRTRSSCPRRSGSSRSSTPRRLPSSTRSSRGRVVRAMAPRRAGRRGARRVGLAALERHEHVDAVGAGVFRNVEAEQ